MLNILGSPRRLCDRLTRREMMRVGGLGAFSLALPQLWGLQQAQAEPQSLDSTFGRAKRIILLYLYGAAAQHETFDPKPDAPAEIRGQFKPTATAVPGVAICEHLPEIAKIADRVTIVRSMSHPYNIHSAAYTLTGIDRVDIPMELDPYDSRHWPFFGSVLDMLQRNSDPQGAATREMPPNIALPFQFSSRCGQFDRGGPYGGFLGRNYDPIWTDFDGQASHSVQRWRGNADCDVADPYAGITPESRVIFSNAARLGPAMTLDRLNRRRSLIEQLDQRRRDLDRSLPTQSLGRFREMAYQLMTSPKIRDAFDLRQESSSSRLRYGMTLFGQSTLIARRLIEAGATLVSVFWDEIDTANSAWDTHFNHYERLQDELLPGLDRALSSLILDLEQRGMLDDTLVMCLTEHGRTPTLHPKPRGVGREHWSQTYCNLLAGGGIARGKVVGQSDRHGAYVKNDPISPKDILCTMYHLMGIDPETTITDPLGRSLPLVAEGRVLRQMIG